MSEPRFIHIEFGQGISEKDYDEFVDTVLDLADKMMKAHPEDCDNEIWVSGRGGAIS